MADDPVTVEQVNLMKSMRHCGYKCGYKYQLAEDYVVRTPLRPPGNIVAKWFILTMAGVLWIRAGYAWDGASGPTFDTNSSMRPSLIHDVFCQMMRERLLDYVMFSKEVHALFYQHCIEDGMWPVRAKIWHAGVVIGRGGNPDQEDDNPVVWSP